MIVKGSEDDIFRPDALRLQEGDLNQLCDLYAEWTGRTVLRPASFPAAKFTIRVKELFTRREAVEAMDKALALSHIVVVATEDRFVKILLCRGGCGRKSVQTPDRIAGLESLPTHIIQLQYRAAKDVLSMLQPLAGQPTNLVAVTDSRFIVFRDFPENTKRMLELIDKVDIQTAR